MARRGRRTARSQNYLAQYGYPSNRALRREAKNVARSSVPTVRSIERPYGRQIQSARDFLQAVQGALAQTNAGVSSAYDTALSQQQNVSDAAQARLAGLGLGVDAAGVQAAAGAGGDSAASQLISNAASARDYSAKLPSIAAGAASVDQAGLRKQMLDALTNRRDQMRQAYFPALESARSAALQRAGFNQSQDQFLKNLGLQRAQMAQQASQFAASQAQSEHQFNISHSESVREFNLSRRDQRAATAASGLTPSEYRQEVGMVGAYALPEPVKPQRVTIYKNKPVLDKDGKKVYNSDGSLKTQRVFDHYSYVTPQGQDTRNIVQKGTPFTTAVQYLQLQGVSMPVILSTLGGLYNQYAEAPQGSPSFDAYWSFREFRSGVNPYSSPGGSQQAHRHR